LPNLLMFVCSYILAQIFCTVNIKAQIFCAFYFFNRKAGGHMDTLHKILLKLKEENKTQKDLTDFLGISKNNFTEWNSGRSNSYFKYISQIAEYLNVSTDYLLGTDKKTSPPSEEDELTAEAIRLFKMLPDDKKRAFLALMDDFGKK